ncbi:MAG: ABC transporter permease subunit [Elusimicrobiota bacterium]
MKNILILLKKELKLYFDSPIAYVVSVLFLLICGYFFATPLFLINQASIRHLMDLLPLLYLFFIPAITMRLFAEEQKTGTIEILFTLPLNDYEILIAKYLSSTILIIICTLITLFYTALLFLVGSPDLGQIISTYIGLFLMCAMFSAVGVFGSTLTKNQIVSFIITFVICFFFYLVGKISVFIPPALQEIINFIGNDVHFENISRGLIDTRDVIYYVSICAFFLYTALVIIKSRK